MRKHILLLIGLLVMTLTTGAQAQVDDDIIRDRAIAVTAQNNPALLDLDPFWSWDGFFQTNDGSLGCPTLTAYDLGYPVTPYRVELDFGELGLYVVYISSDPNVNVICEAPDGAIGYAQPVSQPQNWTVSTAQCTASAFRVGAAPIFTEPSGGDYIGDLGDVSFFPVVGRTADTTWYEIDLGAQSGWVSIYDVTLAGAGCANVGNTNSYQAAQPLRVQNTVPQGGLRPEAPDCTLAATYANIRLQPGLSQPIIGQAVRGQTYYVSGLSSNGEWRQILLADGRTGWVKDTVSNINGAGCNTLPATGQTVEVPPASACPFDFSGYIAPQVLINAEARVINEGGLNVRLTATPDGDQVTQLPADSTVQIIGGPLCENGRVWWQIPLSEAQPQFGWVAESDANAELRYLSPVGVFTTTRFADIASENLAEIGRVEAGGSVVDISFTPAGDQFAIANGADNTIKFWTTADGESTSRYLSHQPTSRVRFVDFQPGGDLVATGDYFNVVNFWRDGEIVQTIQGGLVDYFVSDVAISPDWSQVIIGGCVDGDITLGGCVAGGIMAYNIETGDTLYNIDGFGSSVRNLEFNTDGSMFAVTADDGTVALYDATNGTEITRFPVEAEGVQAIAFSPDGGNLAVALCPVYGEADDGAPVCGTAQVSIFDVISGEQISTITGPADEITSVAYSPDGNLLAIGSYDNSVLLWDVVGDKALESFIGFSNGVRSLTFTPDSGQLAAGDNTGIMILFNVQ
jgi:WD40 repeat protein